MNDLSHQSGPTPSPGPETLPPTPPPSGSSSTLTSLLLGVGGSALVVVTLWSLVHKALAARQTPDTHASVAQVTEPPRVTRQPQPAVAPQPVEQAPVDPALLPGGSEIFLARCKVFDEVMNYPDEEALARRRISKVPDSYTAWAVLGYLQQWFGNLDGARESYAKATELYHQDRLMQQQPLEVRFYTELMVKGQRGIYFFADDDADARFIVFKKRVRLEPENKDAWFILGMEAETRLNLPVMLRCLEELERLDPARAKVFREEHIEPLQKRAEWLSRGGGR